MKKWIKILSVALVIVLTASLPILSVFAEETEWKISKDEKVLTLGDVEYRYCDESIALGVRCENTVVYRAELSFSEFGYYYSEGYEVYTSASNREIAWIEGYQQEYYIYLTQKGETMLEAFLEGDVGCYRITKGYRDAVVDQNVIATLDAMKETVSFDVRELKNAWLYDVTAHDQTDTLSRVYGAIYEIDGHNYYVCYDTLGNQYFDADGNFSYRQGTVPLKPVNEDLSRQVKDSAKRLAYPDEHYEFVGGKNDSNTQSDSNAGEVALFWIVYVLLGFVAPIPLFVVGLTLANSAKRGYPRYWRVLSMIAAIWFALATILLVLLLIG